MDLFQPVTLHIGDHLNPVSFNNLRLAILAVVNDLAPGQREKALIRGREGQLDIEGILQLYEDLKPVCSAH